MIAELGFESIVADDQLQIVPALDIEEILQKRLWEKGRLTERQRADLEEGVEFLELVLRGRAIAEKTVTEGVVSGDLAAIQAYNWVSRTYRRYPVKTDQDFQETLRKSRTLLHKILKCNGQAIDVDEKDIEATRNLFFLLATMSFDLW
jgi:hypothetical protein